MLHYLAFGLLLLAVLWQASHKARGVHGALLALPALLWLGTLWAGSADMQAFFGHAFRDLVLLGVCSAAVALAGPKIGVVLALLLPFVGAFVHVKALDGRPLAFDETSLSAQAELLVELAPALDRAAWQQWITRQGWSSSSAFAPASKDITELDDYVAVNLPDGTDWQAAQAAIAAYPGVDWVEPNEILTLDTRTAPPPSDIATRLGVNDPGVGKQWALQALNMDKLYVLLRQQGVQPRQKALLCILDTGVDARHEDLAGQYLSIKKQYDDDPKGHGTHCAGIAAAITNNGRGIASYALESGWYQVAGIKVLGAGGSGSQEAIVKGILEAADRGASVISLSLGGFSTQTQQRAYSQAVRYANDKGAIVVAAAGNSNRDAASFAPVNAEGVIGVSAVNEQGQRAEFSNTVNRISMAVAAPGTNIYSTTPSNTYTAHSGTSMATPYVSGLLALMKSIRPELTTKEAFDILRRTGLETGNTAATGKLIQPHAAVAALLENN